MKKQANKNIHGNAAKVSANADIVSANLQSMVSLGSYGNSAANPHGKLTREAAMNALIQTKNDVDNNPK